jgi:starvation-inducible DNA-binding protein
MADQKVLDQLNVIVADAAVFYYKLHNYHWFVTGRQFFSLHEKFEELYDHWTELMDDVAERVLTIGGRPPATLAEVLKLATVKEESGKPEAREMVERTLADLRGQADQMRKGIELAEKADDRGTANLLDGFCDEIEKTIWMLEAWLEK